MTLANSSVGIPRECEKLVKGEKITMLALYLGCFAVHCVLTFFTGLFNLTPDEYSVTAVAAFANGFDWSSTVSTGGYYGYFQSIFYIPTYWIFSDPIIRYKAMIMINGLLISLVPVIVYWLSRRVAKTDNLTSIIFGVVCGMYPAYVTLTKFTWNETMCDLLPWVFILLMCLSMRTEGKAKKHVFSALAGLSLAAAYATHGRMLALVAAGVVLVVVVFFAMKKRVFFFTSFFGALAVGFVADSFIKKFLQHALWLTGQTEKAPINTIERMLQKLADFDGEKILTFFKILFGHIFYFLGSTWGFGAICLVAIITSLVVYFKRRAKKEEQLISDETAVLGLFAFLSMGAIFCVSTIFKSFSTLIETRMDTAMYGRYTEVFFPIAIFVTLVLISKSVVSFRQYFASLLTGAGLCGLFVLFTQPLVLKCPRIVAAMVLGLSPLRYGEGVKAIYTSESFTKIIITIIAVLLVFLFVKAFVHKESLIVSVVMGAVLIYSGMYNFANYNLPQATTSYNNAMKVSDAVGQISSASEEFPELVGFNLAKERYVKLQYMRPEFNVTNVKSINAMNGLDFKPDFIVSNCAENLEFWYSGIYRITKATDTHPIYVASEEAKQWALDNGFTVSRNGVLDFSADDILMTSGVKPAADGSLALDKNHLVYTHYMTLQPNVYTMTAEGKNIGNAQISLTADKGDTKLGYEIIERTDDKVVIKYAAAAKLENVRLKYTNKSDGEMAFTSLVFEKANISTLYENETEDDETPENDS